MRDIGTIDRWLKLFYFIRISGDIMPHKKHRFLNLRSLELKQTILAYTSQRPLL